MKHLKNFLNKREQSQARLSFAKREKSRLLAKLTMTLVALLAVTTGAWAQEQTIYLELTSPTTATLKYSSSIDEYSDKANYSGSSWTGNGDYHPNTIRANVQTITVDASCANLTGDKLRSIFMGFSALKTITGLRNINTASVTTLYGMFSGCSSLTSVDFSGFNMGSITNMGNMFSGCTSLQTIDLSALNTAGVTNMSNMFNSCTSLVTLDLSSWNTSSVTNMSGMFAGCESLENIYVGDGWNTGDQLTSHSYMFYNCVKLPNWNNNVTDKTNAHTGAGGYLKTKSAGSAVTVDWNKTTKTGTFSMPAGNVELQVEYYPGMLVKPTNLVGGTMEIEGLTDTTLPEGFEKDDDGNIYVAKDTKFTVKAVPAEGYHLVGWSDDAENKELEREFTMGDDDFILTATFSDEYDLAFNALNANTIEDGKATVKVGDTDKTADIQDGKLTGVKYGQTVTLTAATGYKFRKAEATKTVNMLYIEASNHKLYYMEGETWRQAIDNHTDLNQGWQYGGMEVWFGNIVNVLKGNGAAVDPGSVIDPTKTYTL